MSAKFSSHLYHLLFKSNRLRISFALFCCYYLSLWLMWLIFYFLFLGLTETLNSQTWQNIIYLQHKFNIRLSIIVIIPILFCVVIPKQLLNIKKFKSLARFYYSVLIVLTLTFYIFNWGYFVYLANPLDASALRFLEDGAIATEFVWQSYPVISILLALLLMSFLLSLIAFFATNWLTIKNVPQIYRIKFTSRIVAFLIIFFLIVGGLFGKLSQYPLRWSEAFFSSNPKVAYLSLNPVLYFYDTLKNNHIQYDLEKTKQTYPLIANALGIENPNNQNLNYSRLEQIKDENAEQYNVVFIMLESLGANRLGIFGNPLSPTPNLDNLAKNGYFFNNFFVPNNGTARTVYTSIFGIPDVSPIKTASRNPLIVEQSTLMNEFKGYKKHYLIGGSTSWANIRGILNFNIKDLNLYEGDYDENYPKTDVWGISDTNLFKKAHQVFENEAQNNQKFIAYIQTAGNHRPFTIPEDNENFENKVVSDDLLIKNSFLNIEQFNGIRFLDHNIGYFFKLFEKSSYYGKTIFVLFGDHNDSTNDAPHMRPLESKTYLDALHVPMIIYAPGIIQPKEFNIAASLMDVFPTMSYLANVRAENRTLGTNLLLANENHAAFTLRGNMLEPTIGVVQKDYYFRSLPDGKNSELFDLKQNEYKPLEITDENQGIYDYLKNLASAYFESARYLMYNNSKDTQ